MTALFSPSSFPLCLSLLQLFQYVRQKREWVRADMKPRKELLRKNWKPECWQKHQTCFLCRCHSLSLSHTLPLSIDYNLPIFFSSGFTRLTLSLWIAISCVEGTSLDWISTVTQWSSHSGHTDRYASMTGFPFLHKSKILDLTDRVTATETGGATPSKPLWCHGIYPWHISCCIHPGKLRGKQVRMAGERRKGWKPGNDRSMKFCW